MTSVAPTVLIASLAWVPIAVGVLVVAAAVAVEIVLADRVLNRAPESEEEQQEEEATVADGPPVEAAPSSELSDVAYQRGDRPTSARGLAARRQATLDDATEKTMAELFAQLGDRRLDGEQAARLAQAVAEEVTRSVGDAAGSDVDERAGFESALRDAISLRLAGTSVSRSEEAGVMAPVGGKAGG